MNSKWAEHRKRVDEYIRLGLTVSGGDRAAQNAARLVTQVTAEPREDIRALVAESFRDQLQPPCPRR